jgi:hypothetical protein
MNGKDITPGWRSMMHGLLLDGFGTGSPYLTKQDIPTLIQLRDKQLKGFKPAPFDWSQEIADTFDKIIARLKKRGSATIESNF